MNIEHNMQYEMFVRKIFDDCNRLEDPLRLANTDVNQDAYQSGNLNNLRLGVAYSLCRLLVRLENEFGETGSNYDKIEEWIEEIMNSQIKYNRIHEIIESSLQIIKKYF